MNAAKRFLLVGTLVLSGCVPVAQAWKEVTSGWCSTYRDGQTLYRGGQTVADETGIIAIQFERNAAVVNRGVGVNDITIGATNFTPDDGKVDIGEWEALTASGPEQMVRTWTMLGSKYEPTVQPAFPDHIMACVDRTGKIGLAEDTFYSSVDKDWLKADIATKLTDTENSMASRRWGGGPER